MDSCLTHLSNSRQVVGVRGTVREDDVTEVGRPNLHRTLKAMESSLDFIPKAMRSDWKFLSKAEMRLSDVHFKNITQAAILNHRGARVGSLLWSK